LDTGSDSRHDLAGGEGAQARRHLQRLDRQARVGILRNLNRPAVPPPHRPQLMGRWLRMRSSRRPPHLAEDAQGEPDAYPHTMVQSPLVQTGQDGIARIDIAQLMASVEGVGHAPRPRSGYAATVTGPSPGPTGTDAQTHPRSAPRVASDRLGPAPGPEPGPESGPEPAQGDARLLDAQTGGMRSVFLRLMHRLPGLGVGRG
jgi:hypothetical protein